MHSRAFPASTSLFLLSALLLGGCGVGVQGTGSSSASVTMQGRIMGGQQPVSHASVQLYQVTTGGYGAQSTPMLTPAVSSGPDGSFSFTGLFNCPTDDTQVYLVATGGNPGFDETNGTVNNPALALMAALGNCGDLNSGTNININELTTVAGVWALAPFMKSFDHVGTSATNTVGLANAFNMASDLVNWSSGLAPGAIPAGATVPVTELNTMANVLASCVNTKGGTSGDLSACGNLFALATPPGGATPLAARPHIPPTNTPPTNTIDAALNIALYPGNNAAAIAILPTPQAPFQPAGYAANDWTVAITFPVGARTTSGMAFDATGNLFVVAPDALYELSPTGTVLNTFGSMAGNSVAIDAPGNIWVSSGNSLLKMPSTLGTPVTYDAPNPPSVGVDGLAIDGSGDAWYTCDNCSSVFELSPTGTFLGSVAAAPTSVRQTNISIDTNENVWMGNFDYAQVNVFTHDRTALPNSPFSCGNCGHPAFVANDGVGNAWIVGNDLTHLITSTGAFTNYDASEGGIFSPAAVAIDGAGNAWVANTVSFISTEAGSISEFSTSGTPLSPATAYVSDSVATPQSIAVDGSGSVWVRNTGAASVTAFVGAGVPTVTPLALGVQNNSLGSKP